MQNAAQLTKKIQALIESCTLLEIPIQSFEQYPKGLGKTIPDLKTKSLPIEKTRFSCCSAAQDFLKNNDTTHILLSGIETHVCVYQSALAFLKNGYAVSLVVDATSSRFEIDSSTALRTLQQKGCELVTVEQIVFQMLQSSDHPLFKPVQKVLLSCC